MANFPLATVNTDDNINFIGNPKNVAYTEFTIVKSVGSIIAAASHSIQAEIPANSVIDWIYIRNTTAYAEVTGTSPISIGVGTVAAPELYGLFTTTTIDEVGENAQLIPALHQPSSEATGIFLNQTDAGNAITGTMTGIWDIVISGRTFLPLSGI